jgi:hypothetical protein
MVSLTRPGGERRYAYVHDLVAEAFIGAKPAGLEVCHGPAGRVVNAAANLRYDTRSNNALDRHRDGTMNQARGDEHFFAKMSDSDVRAIRASGATHRALGERFGVSHSVVGRVKRREAWAHVA